MSEEQEKIIITLTTPIDMESDPVVSISLNFRESSLNFLEEIARLTDRAPIDTVVEDALRSYAWLLQKQVTGHSIALVPNSKLGLLENIPGLDRDIEVDSPVDFISPEILNDARQFFE